MRTILILFLCVCAAARCATGPVDPLSIRSIPAGESVAFVRLTCPGADHRRSWYAVAEFQGAGKYAADCNQRTSGRLVAFRVVPGQYRLKVTVRSYNWQAMGEVSFRNRFWARPGRAYYWGDILVTTGRASIVSNPRTRLLMHGYEDLLGKVTLGFE